MPSLWSQIYQPIVGCIFRSGKYSSLPSQKPSKFCLGKSYSGWRGGCLFEAFSTALILVINLSFTIWCVVHTGSGMSITTILVADCSSVNRANTILHYVINALGTLLMGASNYSMQCLSSPTRKEIDDAHTRGTYIDIGMVSFRNLI